MNYRFHAVAGLALVAFCAASHADTALAGAANLGASLTAVPGPDAVFLGSTLSFDNLTSPLNAVSGAAVTVSTSAPNTFMGDTYVLAAGSTAISGFDLAVFNNTGTSYTGLKATIYVWGAITTGTVSATNPAFSNLLGSYTATFSGAVASTSASFTVLQTGIQGSPAVSLTTPLNVPTGTLGVTVNFQGTTDGISYASANNLTSVITNGVPASTGSDPSNGYYRNGNGEVDGNFTSGVRTLGLTNQSVGLRIYSPIAAAVPEPATDLLMGLGVAALMLRRRRAD